MVCALCRKSVPPLEIKGHSCVQQYCATASTPFTISRREQEGVMSFWPVRGQFYIQRSLENGAYRITPKMMTENCIAHFEREYAKQGIDINSITSITDRNGANSGNSANGLKGGKKTESPNVINSGENSESSNGLKPGKNKESHFVVSIKLSKKKQTPAPKIFLIALIFVSKLQISSNINYLLSANLLFLTFRAAS